MIKKSLPRLSRHGDSILLTPTYITETGPNPYGLTPPIFAIAPPDMRPGDYRATDLHISRKGVEY